MDKKRSLLNVIISIAFKIVLLIAGLFTRRFLIQYAGEGVNGLNSLYVSVIGFLAVADLGIGSAISFCMYKPIVEGQNNTVSALYHLFTKLYLIIGVIIATAGCIVMPFLKYLAKGYESTDVNLYLTFGLMLISVVISYLYSSKSSLINAYKDNFITTTINSLALLLQNGLQIIFLIYTKSFVWFLVCQIISTVLQWLTTECIARIRHNDIIKNKQKIDAETRKEVVKNVKAMFMHKIGGVLVNTSDSLIISSLISVLILGRYTNYTTIMTAMVGVITLFFTPLTSIIGHTFVETDLSNIKRYFSFFHTFNFIIATIFFLGYYAVIDDLVSIMFGSNLEMSKSVSFVITLNYFIQFMKQATGLFRDATGTFYNDRWKPLVEGVINIILSILFVLIFPEDLKVVGVIVATIITNLFVCHTVEPYVLFKNAFKSKANRYYIVNYIYILVFVCLLIVLHFCLQTHDNQFVELVINGCIAIAIALVPCIIAAVVNKNFRYYIKSVFYRIKRKTRGE